MKRALIATVFNEADNIALWWDCLRAQTVFPDEIVIVDGGSTDGTWELLKELGPTSPAPLRLERQRCNIAAGRNLAIQLTSAEIIASCDAGSFPAPAWFAEITQPLLDNPDLDVTGGRCRCTVKNDFQRYLAQFESAGDPEFIAPANLYPSSRNTAFRRAAWASVGGYPEWLTLTAEDALFTMEMHKAGRTFLYAPRALVEWHIRGDAASYFKMLYRYGYGSGEARIHGSYFRRRLLITLFPLLLLLSKHRFSNLGFRFRKNKASATGWLAGMIKGHKPPPGWKRIDGVLLSPEARKNHLLINP